MMHSGLIGCLTKPRMGVLLSIFLKGNCVIYLSKLSIVNFDYISAGKQKLLQLNELDEWQYQAYENSNLYKEKTKRWDDRHLVKMVFKEGDAVLLCNSHLRLFLGKLKSRWSRLFTISKVFPYDTTEVTYLTQSTSKVNGEHLKPYFGKDVGTLQKDHRFSRRVRLAVLPRGNLCLYIYFPYFRTLFS